MALHKNLGSLVRESLPEYLEIARYSITAKKHGGGTYGFPGALLLLTCVDVIGSFCRGNQAITFLIDGQSRHVSGNKEKHFWILNSKYFGLDLTQSQISQLYECFRCLLVHNASLAPGFVLANSAADDPPFVYGDAGAIEGIYLHGFFVIVETAVSRFLADIERLIPGSHQESQILKKT